LPLFCGSLCKKRKPNMPSHALLTIGHSNISAERFLVLLQGAGVDTVADVRSTPQSRFVPGFRKSRWRRRSPPPASVTRHWATFSAVATATTGSIATVSPTTKPWRLNPATSLVLTGSSTTRGDRASV
jgi:hypothetical protein